MENGQLHHIEYYVDDLERSQTFWSWLFPILGYSLSTWADGVNWTHPNGTYFCFVRTQPLARGVKNDRQGAGLNHLAFYHASATPQAELARELAAHGARMLWDEPNYLCFEDPNGFAIELYLKKQID